MRVLMLAYFFPPYNTIGAVRTGKTAKFLRRFGHDVRVVSAADQMFQPTLPLEIEPERLIQTRWWDVNRPVEWVLGGRKRVASEGFTPGKAGQRSTLLSALGRLYKSLLHVPDGQIGWYPFAYRAACRVLQEWPAEVIVASATPFTSLLLASRLARRFGTAWVGDLRDLWVDNTGNPHPRWRRKLERSVERRTLRSAAGLVTVSEPLAERLRELVDCPVDVVLNGFDPADYPPCDAPISPVRQLPTKPTRQPTIRLAYTGMAYQQGQDPRPLFEAIRQLGPLRHQVRVDFYGRYVQWIARLAEDYGVADQIGIRGVVPYQESLRIQRQADALVFLLWTDPQARGIFSGKLFEYLGARRPILAIGPDHDEPAQLIRTRAVGTVSNDSAAIAEQLRAWIAEKQSRGSLPDLPASRVADLTRERQTRRFEQFLQRLVSQEPVVRANRIATIGGPRAPGSGKAAA